MYGAKLQRLILRNQLLSIIEGKGGLSILRGDQSSPTEYKEGDSGKLTAN